MHPAFNLDCDHEVGLQSRTSNFVPRRICVLIQQVVPFDLRDTSQSFYALPPRWSSLDWSRRNLFSDISCLCFFILLRDYLFNINRHTDFFFLVNEYFSDSISAISGRCIFKFDRSLSLSMSAEVIWSFTTAPLECERFDLLINVVLDFAFSRSRLSQP